MVVGVLAIQGAFIEHEKMLEKLGVTCVELRKKEDLNQPIDGLVLPGGESTVQGKLLKELDMFLVLKKKIEEGLPVLATCAGLILLAEKVENDEEPNMDYEQDEKYIKASFMSVKYELEDKVIKYYPREIAELTGQIKGFESDIAIVAQYPKQEDKFYPMTIEGLTYFEKERIFKLDTPKTSYLMGVVDEENFLGHIYYGKRIEDYNIGYLMRTGEPPFVPSNL